MNISTMDKKLKHRQVYEQLVGEFSGGRFHPGERLPSERDFAARLNVNIRTVRRAFRDLIVGGIVEKRVGSGTYLKVPLDETWAGKPVNIILSNVYGGQVRNMIEQLAPAVAAEKKRRYRIIYTDRRDQHVLLRSCVNYSQPTVLCLQDLAEADEIYEAPWLFVALSSMVYQKGVPCVQCDDTKGITLLVDHLKSLGHRRIAFLSRQNTGDGLSELQSAVWASALGKDFDPDLKFSLDLPLENCIRASYDLIRKALKRTNFSALICATDELMYDAMAAIRESGRSIPEDISIVSIGNTPLAEFAFPPVTSCDPDIKAHLEMAFELLDSNHRHQNNTEKLRLVAPKLIIRKSTSKCKEKEK